MDDHSDTDQTNVLDLVLDELATRVADQIAARLGATETDPGDPWLDSRNAADYLGVSRTTVRRLAAEGSLNTEQAGANCKLYFRDAGGALIDAAPPAIQLGASRSSL